MSDLKLLDDYITRTELAAELGCCTRSIARMESLADGLPSVVLAGRKLYRKASVLDWLAKRERRPNPRRAA
jgi:hypothetical protein